MATPLLERFRNGEIVTIAEGYIAKFEERGYVQAGPWINSVVLDFPLVVKQQYEEFVRAGSDVIVAFTYFGNKAKLQEIGRAEDFERLNVTALRLAKEVAANSGTLVAGDIAKTGIWKDDPETIERVAEMLKEQIVWAAEHEVDFMLAEAFYDFAEALLTLQLIQAYGGGLPAVVQLAPGATDYTRDGVYIPEALRLLEEAGAAAVGLNCRRGPDTMLPLMRRCREVVKGPLGCAPVAYRTTAEQPTWHELTYPGTDETVFDKIDLDLHKCSRSDMAEFARKAKAIGVSYLGVCCGNTAAHFRAMSEALGRQAASSRFSPDFSKHFVFGKKNNA